MSSAFQRPSLCRQTLPTNRTLSIPDLTIAIGFLLFHSSDGKAATQPPSIWIPLGRRRFFSAAFFHHSFFGLTFLSDVLSATFFELKFIGNQLGRFTH